MQLRKIIFLSSEMSQASICGHKLLLYSQMEALRHFLSLNLLCNVRNPWSFLPCCVSSRGFCNSPNLIPYHHSSISSSDTPRHFLTEINAFYLILFNIFQLCLMGLIIGTPLLLFKAKKELPRNPIHSASKIIDHFCVLTGVKQAQEA